MIIFTFDFPYMFDSLSYFWYIHVVYLLCRLCRKEQIHTFTESFSPSSWWAFSRFSYYLIIFRYYFFSNNFWLFEIHLLQCREVGRVSNAQNPSSPSFWWAFSRFPYYLICFYLGWRYKIQKLKIRKLHIYIFMMVVCMLFPFCLLWIKRMYVLREQMKGLQITTQVAIWFQRSSLLINCVWAIRFIIYNLFPFCNFYLLLEG